MASSSLRQSCLDLYVDRDQTPSALRALAMLASVMLGASFLVFPASYYDGTSTSYTITANAALISSAALTSSSLLLCAVLHCLSHSSLFRLEALYLGNMVPSFLGLFNLLFNRYSQRMISYPIHEIISLVVASGCAFSFITLSIFEYRKIRRLSSSGQFYEISDTMIELPGSDSSEDLQRMQLMKLFTQRSYQAGSPQDVTSAQCSYKIQWPEATSNGQIARDSSSTLHQFRPLVNVLGGEAGPASVRKSSYALAQELCGEQVASSRASGERKSVRWSRSSSPRVPAKDILPCKSLVGTGPGSKYRTAQQQEQRQYWGSTSSEAHTFDHHPGNRLSDCHKEAVMIPYSPCVGPNVAWQALSPPESAPLSSLIEQNHEEGESRPF